MLKWPFCIGQTEQIVLIELKKTNRPEIRRRCLEVRRTGESLGIMDIDKPAKAPACTLN